MMNLLNKYRIPCFAPEDGGGTAPPSGGGAATAPSAPAGGESPPSSTPSSAPSPTSAPAGAGADGGFDFSDIFRDSPPGATEVVAEVVVPAAPKAKPPATPPQSPPMAVQSEPPAATPPVQAAAPSQATPPTPPPAALDRYDPGVLAHHLMSNEAQALNYVAENVFKLSPQEVEALETNVVDAIPKLLAKVFVKSQQNVLSQLANMVPTMIQRQTVAMRKNDENADKFYAKWPMIKKAEHGELVMKYGAVYRQMHPQATLEQMIEDLGPMVMMAGRIVPQAPAAAPVGQPVNPAAQRAAANGRSPPPSPFVPAGSAAPVSAATAPEMSPWEAMFRQE